MFGGRVAPRLLLAATAALALAAAPAAQAAGPSVPTSSGVALPGGGNSFGPVAIDGNTAVVGEQPPTVTTPPPPLVAIFQDRSSGWAKVAQFGPEAPGEDAKYGQAVAVSGSSGTLTAAVGAGHSVYVYVKQGATWRLQQRIPAPAELEVPGEQGTWGSERGELALSGDTLVIADMKAKKNGSTTTYGAVWVYTRRGSSWKEQAKLEAPPEKGEFGRSVGISGDRMIVGASAFLAENNAAYVYERSGETWLREAELRSSSPAQRSFAGSVAIDGDTAVVGDEFAERPSSPTPAGGSGEAQVFEREAATSSWMPRPPLTAELGFADNAGRVGHSVAISGDRITVGASGGHAFLFRFTTPPGGGSPGGWMPAEELAFPLAETQLGGDVSASGATELLGAAEGDGQDARAYGPGPAPATVTGVSPNGGRKTGGTAVTITGLYLEEATEVRFGQAKAPSFKINPDDSISTVAPPGTGTVDVTVTTPGGISLPLTPLADKFYYSRPQVKRVSPRGGPELGGTRVTIAGTNLAGATEVLFGSSEATSFKVNGENSISAVSPAHAHGPVDVTVVSPNGTSLASRKDRFKYR
jgi:hypothetical protein